MAPPKRNNSKPLRVCEIRHGHVIMLNSDLSYFVPEISRRFSRVATARDAIDVTTSVSRARRRQRRARRITRLYR